MGDTTRFEYDDEASRDHRMDVVHEVIERDEVSAARAWVDAARRLNAINDPLARKLITLHRDCGSGNGPCDSADDVWAAKRWCETTELIADHFGVSYP